MLYETSNLIKYSYAESVHTIVNKIPGVAKRNMEFASLQHIIGW